MTLVLNLPPNVEATLRRAIDGDVEAYLRETLLVTFYRQRMISRKQLSEALGLDRFETDAVLNRHDVTEDLPTVADLRDQVRVTQSLSAGEA